MTKYDVPPGTTISIQQPPQYAGWWLMPGGTNGCGIYFPVYKKPRWLTIKLMGWLMEWSFKTDGP